MARAESLNGLARPLNRQRTHQLRSLVGASASSALEGIAPAKAREAVEIGVIRVNFRVVFYGNAGRVGIRNEVATGASCPKQIVQQIEVTWARLDDAGVIRVKED